jgi:prepilin-type N-terminal cleavage/methylation domain-containing protein
MLNNNMTKQKGFTLIELMIVVAIIGILAAIAIPQFSAYRVKAFNSAAESDLRNLMTAEEATYADAQQYFPINSSTVTGTGGSTTASTFSSATLGTLTGAKVSNQVGFAISTANSAANYAIFTGHSKGDRVYAGNDAGTMRYQSLASGTNAATTATGDTYTTLTSSWGTGAL